MLALLVALIWSVKISDFLDQLVAEFDNSTFFVQLQHIDRVDETEPGLNRAVKP